jgi:uncharacterized protein YuzE
MVRSILCSVVMLGLCVGLSAGMQTTDGKDKTDKEAKEAKITKMDAKKGTVSVKMPSKDKDKEVDKTFKLAEDIVYMDSKGKVATVEIFTSGDLVLIIERDGTITKMKKNDKADSTKKPGSK